MLAPLLFAAALTLPRHAVFGAAVAEKPAGLTVVRVLPSSPAENAGVRAGDVIVSVEGVATPTIPAYLSEIHALHAGESVSVALTRDGKPVTLIVRLAAPPDENDPAVTTRYDTITVDGSLRRVLITIPKQARTPLPGILLIGGIGCFSVDVASDPQDPYLRLARDLSRAGFVTMRLEKSGVGDSQGPPCRSVDFADEERGYAVALNALRANPAVNPKRVYVFGHSIGTVVAPRLAQHARVAGIVVAEAVGRDWFEYELRNARRQLELGGTTAAATDAAMMEKYGCMYRLLVAKESEAAIEVAQPSCKEHNGVYPVDAAYVRQVAALNVIEPWTRLDVPVLAIYGDSDFVTERDDHVRIVAIVNAAHPGAATFREIAGMDHLLYRASSPKAALDAFASGAEREYDADLSAVVIAWLKQQT
ncbi:MAG TPA: alpha/beta fold hydrolase [Candidatus Cybelea sp.]|nr:alpha/beta fold hydrolase [Candidatus Cybelea sp.]